MADFELHLGSEDLHHLLGDDGDFSCDHGFGEDADEIAKIIDEEMGASRSRRSTRKNVSG